MDKSEKKLSVHHDGHRYKLVLKFSTIKKKKTCIITIVSPDTKKQAKVVKTLSKTYDDYKVTVQLTESNEVAVLQIDNVHNICPAVLDEKLGISADELFYIGQLELKKLKYSWS